MAPRPERHVDGVSFLPLLDGDTGFDCGPVFRHYPHCGNQGGTLGETGFIGTTDDTGNVSFGPAGGVLAPGASTGQLTVYGNVNFTSAGNTRFAVDINGTTVGDDYDQLLVLGGGVVTLDESTVLDLNWGFTPARFL